MSVNNKTPATGPNYCPQCGSSRIEMKYAPYSDGRGYHKVECSECSLSAASDVVDYSGEKFVFVGWPVHLRFTSY